MGGGLRVFHRLACRQLVLSRGHYKAAPSLLNNSIGTGGDSGGSLPPRNVLQDGSGTPGNAPFHGGATRSFFTLQKSGGHVSTLLPPGAAKQTEWQQNEEQSTDWWFGLTLAGCGLASLVGWNQWASEVETMQRSYSKWAKSSTDLMVEHNGRLSSVEQRAHALEARLQSLESALSLGASSASPGSTHTARSADPASLAGIESRLAKLEQECQVLSSRDPNLAGIHPMSLNTFHGTHLSHVSDSHTTPPHVPMPPTPPPNVSAKLSDDFSVPSPKPPPRGDADAALAGGNADVAGSPAGRARRAPDSAFLTRDAIANAAARAGPAVVNISSTGKWGLLTVQNEGSGFIVESDGTILTNAHVVISTNSRGGSEKSNNQLTVTLEDGRTYDGEVVSYDTLADLAVVKIQTPTPVPTVQLGVSSTLRPGDWVLALGSPHNLPHTVTAGIISCVDRKSSEMGLTGIRSDYLQTDAAVNQGNSGGPLVNLDGEVIGINTMKLRGTDGVSFAIPIDTAVRVVDQLKKYGRVRQPFVGIKMLELNSQVSKQLRERHPDFPDLDSGILVAQVIPGSPAARAGMADGDVIVEFDNIPVTKIKQLLDILGDRVGEELTAKVKRQAGKDATLAITTEEARADL